MNCLSKIKMLRRARSPGSAEANVSRFHSDLSLDRRITPSRGSGCAPRSFSGGSGESPGRLADAQSEGRRAAFSRIGPGSPFSGGGRSGGALWGRRRSFLSGRSLWLIFLLYYTPRRRKSKPGKWPIRRPRGGAELYKTRDVPADCLLTFSRKSATLWDESQRSDKGEKPSCMK